MLKPATSEANAASPFLRVSAKMAVVVIGLLGAPQVRAQPQSGRLEFEVASIKAAAPPGVARTPNGGYFIAGPSIKWSGATLMLQNFTVKDLIREAYNVKDEQISGPKGLDSQRYQIVAKAPAHTTEDQARLMAQSLLADRFNLQIHHEQRELPGYALVVTKGGPHLKKAEKLPEPKPEEPVMFKIGRGRISQPLTMTGLAAVLTTRLGRPVSDMTGLMGEFDIKLDWTPDESEPDPFAGLPPKPGAPGGVGQAQDGPSIFAAIQEQLGLKLEVRKRTPIEVIVVDHVEKASEN